MTSGSHRALLYWVLLLLPTLAVGGGVLWLLSREQARLDAQTRAAVEAHRAAVGARARLIAENVELLVGDVQSGLMATLREVPAGAGREGFLDNWRRTNPLVRGTFCVAADGRGMTLGGGVAAGWFKRLRAQGEPWRAAAGGANPAQGQAVAQMATANAMQVNTAR